MVKGLVSDLVAAHNGQTLAKVGGRRHLRFSVPERGRGERERRGDSDLGLPPRGDPR